LHPPLTNKNQVSLIATVWAFFTLLLFRRSGWAPLYFSVADLCFFGVLIGGVVILAPYVRNTDCVSYTGPTITYYNGQGTYSTGSLSANRQCLMLKSSWGLAIVDILLFFFSSVLAWHVWSTTGVVTHVHVTHQKRSSGRRRRRQGGW
jgi:hypothetical protein